MNGRSRTLGGSGDYNIDFLLPFVEQGQSFLAIYTAGIRNDRIDWPKIFCYANSFLASGSDVAIREEICRFYDIKADRLPETNDQLLRCIYEKSDLAAEVVTRSSEPDLRIAFKKYCELLQRNGRADFTNDLKSERSRIIFIDFTGQEYLLETIQMLKGTAFLRVAGEWLKAQEIFRKFRNVRFTGDLSFIQQLEFGLPSFIPWYVRYHGRNCGRHAQIEIAEQLLPIYALRLDRRTLYLRRGELEGRPWGLLWDVFDFNSRRKSVSEIEAKTDIVERMPKGIEEILMRAALRDSLGIKRRRAAARNTIDGLEQSVAKVHSPDGILSEAGSILGAPSLFSEEFHLRLSLLLVMRALRNVLYQRGAAELKTLLETCSLERYLEQINWTAQNDGARRVLLRLKNFKSCDPQRVLDWAAIVSEEKTAFRSALCGLREQLIDELISRWADLEATYRVSPYKVFALLPFYQLHRSWTRRPETKRSMCLLCGRL